MPLLQLEKLISKNYYLHQSAKDGYRSYLQAYASYSLKSIFDINKLDLQLVGKSFGFAIPPKVNISIGTSLKAGKKARKAGADSDESDDEAGDGKPKKAYYRSQHQNRKRPRVGN
jgi:ATP-dependent RNA helicase DDX18/HAS1